MAHPIPPEAAFFFRDRPRAREVFDALHDAVLDIGPVDVVATKSRVSFLGRTRFCWVHEATMDGIWIGFHHPAHLGSPRLRSGRIGDKWSHHLKLTVPEVDDELRGWLQESYAAFGAP